MGVKNKNVEDFYPLSPMQQGIFFHSIAAPDKSVYFEQFSWTIQGNFNIAAFQQAWQYILDRYSVLRTCFVWEGLKEPVQIVHRQVTLPWVLRDLRHLLPVEQQQQLEAFLKSDRHQGFELTRPPLMRLTLHHLAENSYHFTWSHHHLLLDGWSNATIYKEVFDCYKAFNNAQDIYLEPVRSYRDYIVWLQQQNLSQAQAFWQQVLKGFTEPTQVLIGKGSGQLLTSKNGNYQQNIKLSAEKTAALQQMVQQHQVTINTVVQGAWALLLSRYSGQEDVVFGAVTSGRPPALTKADSMVGLFINTLPVRVQISAKEFLLPWLKQIQTQQIETRQYEYSRLVEVQGWSEVPRGLSLFESIVVFENYPVDASLRKLDIDLEINSFSGFEKTNYPLTLSVNPGEELLLKMTYDDRERFDVNIINRMLGHLKTLLEVMVANPHQRLYELPLLSEPEQHQLLVEWNNTQVDYPQQQCIHQLFEAQVERTPDAVAVVFEDEQLTYCELNARANQLAHYLRFLGVGLEVLVGICVERSLSMVIGLLGILKAGGAYLPLDPTYPKQRLAFMLEDAQLPVLLTQQRLVEKLPEHEAQVVCLDTDSHIITQQSQGNPGSISKADNLAYVIYTSGSTGQPKGVFGLHRGAVNRFHWMWQNYPFIEREICCHKTSLNFVDSVWEIFGPLLQGVPTVIVPDSVLKDPQELVAALASNNVTRLVLVPSLLRILLETCSDLQLQLPQLKLWVSSGEPLLIDLLQQFRQSLPDSTLLNLYGSSEVSADVTCYSLSPDEPLPDRVLIGRPIANIQIYVLDANKLPVPVGVTGELHIGGDGLARGYLNRPELTAEKFIPNPFENSKSPKFRSPPSGDLTSLKIQNSKWNRLYKTGDLARYLPNGEIEYLGRIDHQVKVRGFRIELGEIEAHLRQHPKIRETVVVVRSDSADSQRIVAYVVPQKEQTLTITELRDFLESKLPNYIVPTAFVMLEALPLTPNGKVDRKVLPAPDTARPELEAVYQPPQTEIEQTIAKIWLEVLHVDNVGIHDNFFELGGHSLLLLQVHSKFCKVFERDFSVLEMFRYPTISSLAEFLNQANKNQILFNQISDRTVQLEDGKTRTKQFLRISKISKKIK